MLDFKLNLQFHACKDGSCYTSCETYCGTGCAVYCTRTCDGCSGCGSGCSSSCSGYCDGCSGCGSGCSYSCSGYCDGCSGCGGACSSNCSGTCSGSCVGTCTGDCNNACTATNQVTNINDLGSNIGVGKFIAQNDLKGLKTAIDKELTRRGRSSYITPYTTVPNLGVHMLIEHPTKLFGDINDVGVNKGYAINTNNIVYASNLTSAIAYIKTLALQNIK